LFFSCRLCIAGGWVISECSDAEQRRWNLLHPDRRTWTLDGHVTPRIHLQVTETEPPTESNDNETTSRTKYLTTTHTHTHTFLYIH